MEKNGKIGIEGDNWFAKTWALFSKQHGFWHIRMREHYSPIIHYNCTWTFTVLKRLISFCACSFQISIIMFIFLYRLTGGDDHVDQRGKACLKCFCDTFDSDRCMNSLTRGWMSMCSRSMVEVNNTMYELSLNIKNRKLTLGWLIMNR